MKTRKKKKRATKRTVTKRTKKKRRRNPRNPIVGDTVMAITYLGGEGKRKGRMKGPWEHEFEFDDVVIEGLPDGSIKLLSKSGKRLWDYFEV